MRRIFLSFTILTMSAAGVSATPWSLDSCINYALQHNIQIQRQTLNQKTAELSVTEAKDAFLPQLQAGANQSFNFGRGLTSDNTYANRNTNQFGWNVSLSLPLFQGLSAIRRLDYSRTYLSVIAQQCEAAKDDVTINVIAQYLQVLYSQEMLGVAREQVRMSEVEYNRRKELLEAGKIPELDLIQSESQVAQDRLTVVNSENDYATALLDLAQLLQLPSTDDFEILPMPDNSDTPLSAQEVYNNALSINHALSAARLSIKAADKYISVAKTGYIPRLSFSAGLGSSYYNLSGSENPPFHRQMRDNFNKSLGFSLSIPIFDAFSTRNSVRRAQVQKVMAELDYEDACNILYKSIQQAYQQAVAAINKQSASQTACSATKSALEAMTEKYNYGKANATEYEQAKSEYIKASSQAVQAKYEAMLRMRILRFYNENH